MTCNTYFTHALPLEIGVRTLAAHEGVPHVTHENSEDRSRATRRQETLIQQAASQTDRSVSEFILSSATIEAERVLADRRWFSVTSERFDAIEAVLDAPLEETSRFARLWNRPSPFGTRIDLDNES